MTGPGREERALAQLLKAAKASAEELQSRLANLVAARQSAATSLEWLAQAVRAEAAAREAQTPSAHDLSRFIEGADLKRAALAATRDTLEAEIGPLEDALTQARDEYRKLERLIAMTRRTVRDGRGGDGPAIDATSTVAR